MKTITLLFVLMLMMTEIIDAQIPPIEAGVAQTLAKWRTANYRDVRYKLNLTLEKMSPVLKGTIEIKVNVRQNGAEAKKTGENSGSFQTIDSLPTIVLDWRKIKGRENLSTISNVSVNGRRVVLNADFSKFNFIVEGREEQNFFENNEHLVFQDGVKFGENVIKLDFTSPIATSGAAVTRYVDKEDGAEYVYSLFVPSDASTAFPVFDQPDLKAKFSLDLNVPAKWNVISNTRFHTYYHYGKDSNGKDVSEKPQRFVFHETMPISTYLFAFAAGGFQEISSDGSSSKEVRGAGLMADDGLLRQSLWGNKSDGEFIYVRKSQAEKFKPHAAETFRLNREAVKYLEGYFDYKFPFPKYDLVLIPEFPFGGMEHAGATFLRESSIIFPSEPTANDFISRANLIFHEAAHQWFGDTVTMRWFDDLWLKEGFAEFMAYKTLEKVLPEYNAWKAFYERNKPLAYLTDSTRGTTPIYQEIPNLSAAKSAYGNIVYRKAPSFLRQAEFYLGEDKFQTAVRAFLKKHEYANAEWTDLVKEFETASKQDLKAWANDWVKNRGLAIYKIEQPCQKTAKGWNCHSMHEYTVGRLSQKNVLQENTSWEMATKILVIKQNGEREIDNQKIEKDSSLKNLQTISLPQVQWKFDKESLAGSDAMILPLIFPNYQDYGYGIFLLDERSRDFVLKNIQNEKDDFLRSMMWGTLWDSVREAELAPGDYVALAVKNVGAERDELTIQTILNRVGTAMNYYLSDAQARALAAPLENLLIEKMRTAATLGQRITFYRAFLNTASSENAKNVLKEMLNLSIGLNDDGTKLRNIKPKVAKIYTKNENADAQFPPLKTKDKFDIITKLLILGDKDAP
ncbi:MAG TPA: M1 family aminopeptidase, partial [Pyrinomonadaceae bacterium]